MTFLGFFLLVNFFFWVSLYWFYLTLIWFYDKGDIYCIARLTTQKPNRQLPGFTIQETWQGQHVLGNYTLSVSALSCQPFLVQAKYLEPTIITVTFTTKITVTFTIIISGGNLECKYYI